MATCGQGELRILDRLPRRIVDEMSQGEIIHRRTRNAFRDACSDHAVVRQIEKAFENESFDPDPDDTKDWSAPGARRGTFDRYTSSIDWGDDVQARQLLPVFETILSWVAVGQARDTLIGFLKRDGFEVDGDGQIRSAPTPKPNAIPLDKLADARSIREHLDRIANTMDTDPGVAISGAKAIIEATAKLVLSELGEAYDERADVPDLVKSAQKALLLHRDSIAPSQSGAEVIKRILSNLSSLAIGIAELRNQYGPDHGRTTPVVGLGPRHAHLAVGAASTYCTMLIETLEARRAP